MLAVGGHVLGNLDPRFVRMATGFAGGVGESKQEMCGALSAGVMLIGALYGRYEQVHAPGGLGSCSIVVERAARILLGLLAEKRSER